MSPPSRQQQKKNTKKPKCPPESGVQPVRPVSLFSSRFLRSRFSSPHQRRSTVVPVRLSPYPVPARISTLPPWLLLLHPASSCLRSSVLLLILLLHLPQPELLLSSTQPTHTVRVTQLPVPKPNQTTNPPYARALRNGRFSFSLLSRPSRPHQCSFVQALLTTSMAGRKWIPPPPPPPPDATAQLSAYSHLNTISTLFVCIPG